MRTFLMLTTAAIALAACGPKANDTTPRADQVAGAMVTDNMTVPMDESAGNGTTDAALAGSTPAETFAAQAAASDLFEIESSKMAVEKSTDPALVKFAKQMIDAHTTTTRELKAAAARDNVSVPGANTLEPANAALLDTLKNAGGTDFNRAYRQQQIDSHTKVLTIMQGYADAGDKPALKSFAASTAPKVKAHLDMINTMG